MRPYYEQDGCTIYLGDCRDVMPSLGAVDHVITDPPYSAHVHNSNRRGLTAHAGTFSERRELGFDPITPKEMRDVARLIGQRVTGWVLVFSDSESDWLWRRHLQRVGLDYIRTGFWRKSGGAPQFTGDRPAVSCEAITICHPKGRKGWNGGGKQAFWDVPTVVSRGGRNDVRVHTTQKPERLLLEIVADYTDPDDLILDAYMGSGTTLVAAKRLGRKAIGIERTEKSCEMAAERLCQGALDIFSEVAL